MGKMIDNCILSHTQYHLQTESNLLYLMQDIRKQSPHTDVETKHSITLSKQTLHSHPTQKNVDSRKYFLLFFSSSLFRETGKTPSDITLMDAISLYMQLQSCFRLTSKK